MDTIFNGKVFDGFNYWDIDPTTGEPRKYNLLESDVNLKYFDIGIASDVSLGETPNGLFTIPNSQYLLDNVSYINPSESEVNNPKVEPQKINYTFDTEWLKVNNLLDFRVGDNISSIDTSHITEFFIKYYKGGNKVYKFAIAPSTESYTGGPNQTPEVKSGLLTRSSLAIKTFTLAGGEPVYQVLGIEPTLFYLTGLFIGAEIDNETGASTTALTNNVYNTKASLNAVDSAELFDSEVVKSGRPIEIHLYSKTNTSDKEIKIKYKCIVQNARYFLRRSDRVYYALDLYLMSRLK